MASTSTEDIFLFIIALFLPPVPVFLKTGCGGETLLSFLLWFLGWIPGVIYAWYIIATRQSPNTYGNPQTQPHASRYNT